MPQVGPSPPCNILSSAGTIVRKNLLPDNLMGGVGTVMRSHDNDEFSMARSVTGHGAPVGRGDPPSAGRPPQGFGTHRGLGRGMLWYSLCSILKIDSFGSIIKVNLNMEGLR